MPGADNQQERFRLEGWVSGFIDGEGCFCVNVNRCSATQLGWQVRPEFVVTQGARSIGALEALREFFGCGAIYRNTRHDDHREDVYRWCVRRRSDLEESCRAVRAMGSAAYFKGVGLRTIRSGSGS